jgi:uncharacterized membrane protein YhaH (DUF805 family)
MVSFTEAIRGFFTRYTDFAGRSGRSEYWWPYLMHIVVTLVLVGAAQLTGLNLETEEIPTTATIFLTLLMLYLLAVMIPSIAVMVRRLHDLDKTGWLALAIMVVGLVPLIGLLANIAQIVIGCLPGTLGPNRYGEDPRGALPPVG